MNHFQFMLLGFILLLLNHIEKRRYNQGKRRAEFVTHIGKEIEFQLVEFPILPYIFFHFLLFENHFLLFESSLAEYIDDPESKAEIQQICPYREIKRRIYINDHLADIFAYRSITVHYLHLQGIGIWREVGKSNFRSAQRSHHPFIRDSLHAIHKSVA